MAIRGRGGIGLRRGRQSAALQGVCLCGVRFEVTEPFERISACHCTSCKKISGGGGTVSGRARTDAIRILAGNDLLTTFQPHEGLTKTFCSACGSNLFGGAGRSRSSRAFEALEEPYEGRIGSHIFVRSLAFGETLPEDERYDTRAVTQRVFPMVAYEDTARPSTGPRRRSTTSAVSGTRWRTARSGMQKSRPEARS